MIVSSTTVGEKIAFSRLRLKCVTLDGDIYDPNGTLSGGYIN
jgi:chromosome segregation ATPase